MRRLFILSIVATLAACGSGPSAEVPTSGSFGEQLNDLRRLEGAAALKLHPQLTTAAQAHADDMTARGYFSHGSPTGERADARIARAGYQHCGWAENIAQGPANDSEALAKWRLSPAHLDNLVGRDFDEYGLGRSGENWVLVLAKSC